MLQIKQQPGSANRVVYQLVGEVTADQIARLEALVRGALDSGHELTLDVSGVWRMDRSTARRILRFCSSGERSIRLEGVDYGLLAWLLGVPRGAEGSSPERKEGT